MKSRGHYLFLLQKALDEISSLPEPKKDEGPALAHIFHNVPHILSREPWDHETEAILWEAIPTRAAALGLSDLILRWDEEAMAAQWELIDLDEPKICFLQLLYIGLIDIRAEHEYLLIQATGKILAPIPKALSSYSEEVDRMGLLSENLNHTAASLGIQSTLHKWRQYFERKFPACSRRIFRTE